MIGLAMLVGVVLLLLLVQLLVALLIMVFWSHTATQRRKGFWALVGMWAIIIGVVVVWVGARVWGG